MSDDLDVSPRKVATYITEAKSCVAEKAANHDVALTQIDVDNARARLKAFVQAREAEPGGMPIEASIRVERAMGCIYGLKDNGGTKQQLEATLAAFPVGSTVAAVRRADLDGDEALEDLVSPNTQDAPRGDWVVAGGDHVLDQGAQGRAIGVSTTPPVVLFGHDPSGIPAASTESDIQPRPIGEGGVELDTAAANAVREKCAARVRKMLCEILGVTEGDPRWSLPLDAQLGQWETDSLDHIELVVSVEDEFDIDIRESEIADLDTLAKFVDHILKGPTPKAMIA